MKKLLIAILAVTALSNANQCEDIAERRIDDLKNCKLHYTNDNTVRFRCSNGSVRLGHKNNYSMRRLYVTKYLNMNEAEAIVIHREYCGIYSKDKYDVLENKFISFDVESNSVESLWNYFKRYKVR